MHGIVYNAAISCECPVVPGKLGKTPQTKTLLNNVENLDRFPGLSCGNRGKTNRLGAFMWPGFSGLAVAPFMRHDATIDYARMLIMF